MPRPKKDAVALNVRLDRKLVERFSDYAWKLGQSKTVCLERILEKFLDDVENDEKTREK